jgi:hypothetical protein
MNDIKSILLICNSKDWDIIRSFIEKLRLMNKTVHTAIFAPTKKDVPPWYSDYQLLRADKDVNLFGFPDKILRKQFNNVHADILIDFVGVQATSMYYMILKHPSTFKAGIKHSEDSIYDFSIIPPLEEKDNLLFLFDQIVKYLKIINSRQ